jgi:hypothetical protein
MLTTHNDVVLVNNVSPPRSAEPEVNNSSESQHTSSIIHTSVTNSDNVPHDHLVSDISITDEQTIPKQLLGYKTCVKIPVSNCEEPFSAIPPPCVATVDSFIAEEERCTVPTSNTASVSANQVGSRADHVITSRPPHNPAVDLHCVTQNLGSIQKSKMSPSHALCVIKTLPMVPYNATSVSFGIIWSVPIIKHQGRFRKKFLLFVLFARKGSS